MSFPCSTNNPVVDILVGKQAGDCKKHGDRCGLFPLLPYPCGIRDIDICIVLSNALDNAIHAVKARMPVWKSISVCPGGSRGFPYDGNSEQLPWERRVQKRDRSVECKKVAEKYGGAMSIETQENVFVLHVLLIIPQHPESSTQQMD